MRGSLFKTTSITYGPQAGRLAAGIEKEEIKMIKIVRICAIGLINTIVIVWILKVTFFDKDSDSIGLLTGATILFLLFFNVYAFVLYNIFNNKWSNLLSKIAFFVLLIIPLFIIWYLTSR